MLVSKIKRGIVIDHIPPGRAFDVFRILKVEPSEGNIIALIINAPSRKHGKKDIIKIENKDIKKEDLDRIALLSPKTTVNVIEDSQIKAKYRVEIPDMVQNVLICRNPNCITNHQPIDTKFMVESKSPLRLRCNYCERLLDGANLAFRGH